MVLVILNPSIFAEKKHIDDLSNLTLNVISSGTGTDTFFYYYDEQSESFQRCNAKQQRSVSLRNRHTVFLFERIAQLQPRRQASPQSFRYIGHACRHGSHVDERFPTHPSGKNPRFRHRVPGTCPLAGWWHRLSYRL